MINLLSIEIAKSRDGESSVFKTRIGWWVVGPVSRTKKNSASWNQIPVIQAHIKEVGKVF